MQFYDSIKKKGGIMAFCRFSTELISKTKTEIDNVFINKFMPNAPDNCVKVYLYGLYLCSQTNVMNNTMEQFVKDLSLSEEEVIACFAYWQEQGLVQILSTNPIEIRFIPLNNVFAGTKLYKTDKYESFNRQAQELFSTAREITKTEYGEYYDFLERYKMEQDALIMLMQYCIVTKKKNIGYPYILTVAKNWANEGVLTVSDLEDRLFTYEEYSTEIGEVLKALGIKRASFIEEKHLFRKWKDELSFNLDVILHIAKKIKLKKGANFEKLDSLLMKYHALNLYSIMEIEEFENQKTSLFEIAKSVNNTIGVYYENLEMVVENYVSPWINLGFNAQTIMKIATYCRKASIRTLEGVNDKIQKFFKLGITTSQALHNHLESIISQDAVIQKILSTCNIMRKVNYLDRDLYKVWTSNWNMSEELINYASELAVGKNQPLQYMNSILSNWFTNKISTLDKAKSTKQTPVNMAKSENFKGRSYKNEELTALIQSIDEVEI